MNKKYINKILILQLYRVGIIVDHIYQKYLNKTFLKMKKIGRSNQLFIKMIREKIIRFHNFIKISLVL